MKTTIVTAALFAAAMSFAVPSAKAASQYQCGTASWYALHHITASGEMMNPDALTAAHLTLPFGTRLKVVNQDNGKEITVTINDRGPYIKGRIIDLSRAAATVLGFRDDGLTKVCLARI